MAVHRKNALLSNHAILRLTLNHAAFVDSYPLHEKGIKLPVNRLLFALKEGSRRKSSLHDPADGRTLPMRAGNLCFIPCNRPVDMDFEDDFSFLSLQFNLDLFYGFDVMEACPRCETLSVPELTEELNGLLESETELKSLLRVNEIVFGLCARLAPKAPVAVHDRLVKSRVYAKALDFVRLRADASTSVGELARTVGMRQDVFSRGFARDLGATPKDFLSDALARKASELLLSPGNAVKDVARILNFSSEYYFSHFFKRRTGHSPLEFQKQNAGKAMRAEMKHSPKA